LNILQLPKEATAGSTSSNCREFNSDGRHFWGWVEVQSCQVWRKDMARLGETWQVSSLAKLNETPTQP